MPSWGPQSGEESPYNKDWPQRQYYNSTLPKGAEVKAQFTAPCLPSQQSILLSIALLSPPHQRAPRSASHSRKACVVIAFPVAVFFAPLAAYFSYAVIYFTIEPFSLSADTRKDLSHMGRNGAEWGKINTSGRTETSTPKIPSSPKSQKKRDLGQPENATCTFNGSNSCGNSRSAYLGPARCAYRGQCRSRTFQQLWNKAAYLGPARCAYRGQCRSRTFQQLWNKAAYLGPARCAYDPKAVETTPAVVLT